MKFYTQYKPKKAIGLHTSLPSETVPDQSMTIQEIIARYVRTGNVPVPVHTDIGDNEAFEPDFDPLDMQPAEVIASLRPKAPEAPKEPESPKEPEAPKE